MSTHDGNTDENFTGATSGDPFPERVRVRGEAMVAKFKELLHEGNVQRIVVKNSGGHTVMEIPVNAGVVATIVAPVLIAVAAIAALASDWEIVIFRSDSGTSGIPAS